MASRIFRNLKEATERCSMDSAGDRFTGFSDTTDERISDCFNSPLGESSQCAASPRLISFPQKEGKTSAAVMELKEQLDTLKTQAKELGLTPHEGQRRPSLQRRNSEPRAIEQVANGFLLFSKKAEEFIDQLGSTSSSAPPPLQRRLKPFARGQSQQLSVSGFDFQDFHGQIVYHPEVIKLQRGVEVTLQASPSDIVQQELRKFKDCLLEQAWHYVSQIACEAQKEAGEVKKRAEEAEQRCAQMETGYVKEVMDVRTQLRRLPQELPSLDVEMWEPLQCLGPQVRGLVEACAEERLRTLLSKSEIVSLVRDEHQKDTNELREELRRQTAFAKTYQDEKQDAEARVGKVLQDLETSKVTLKVQKQKTVQTVTDLQRCREDLSDARKSLQSLKQKLDETQVTVQETKIENTWTDLLAILENSNTDDVEVDSVEDRRLSKRMSKEINELSAELKELGQELGHQTGDDGPELEGEENCGGAESEIVSLLNELRQDLGPDVLQEAVEAAELGVELESPAPVITTLARHIGSVHKQGAASAQDLASVRSEIVVLNQEVSKLKDGHQQLSKENGELQKALQDARSGPQKIGLDASTSTTELPESDDAPQPTDCGTAAISKPITPKAPLHRPSPKSQKIQRRPSMCGASAGPAEVQPQLAVGSGVDLDRKPKPLPPVRGPPRDEAHSRLIQRRNSTPAAIQDATELAAALSATPIASQPASGVKTVSDAPKNSTGSSSTPAPINNAVKARRNSLGNARPALGPEWAKVAS